MKITKESIDARRAQADAQANAKERWRTACHKLTEAIEEENTSLLRCLERDGLSFDQWVLVQRHHADRQRCTARIQAEVNEARAAWLRLLTAG